MLKHLLSRWKLVRTETRLVNKDIPGGNVTSSEWRSNANATASASQVLNSPDMKAILAIMRNETPMDMVDLAWGATAEDIARHHGYQKGYLHALLKLKSFGILADDKQKDEPMTFENEDK